MLETDTGRAGTVQRFVINLSSVRAKVKPCKYFLGIGAPTDHPGGITVEKHLFRERGRGTYSVCASGVFTALSGRITRMETRNIFGVPRSF